MRSMLVLAFLLVVVETIGSARAQNPYCLASVGDPGGDQDSKIALIKRSCKAGDIIGIPTRGNFTILIPALCDFSKTVTPPYSPGGLVYCVFVGAKPGD